MRKLFAALAIAAVATASFTFVRAEEPAKKADQMPRCPIDPKAGAALERIKALTGTWTAAGEAGAPEMKVVFHPTAGGSAVMETMFPGSDHEMVNLFTANGSTIFMTHYCVENEQPHMKLTSGDEATMKFEFVDGGNIKSRNDPHMDGVAITVAGDKLTEEWSFYSEGKVTDRKVFEFHREAQPQSSK